MKKEFPSRHISSTEDLRVLLNEFLDNCITMEEYNHLLGKLEDLEELLRQKDEEIERLTKEQPKKTLKKLDKKPLKRLK